MLLEAEAEDVEEGAAEGKEEAEMSEDQYELALALRLAPADDQYEELSLALALRLELALAVTDAMIEEAEVDHRVSCGYEELALSMTRDVSVAELDSEDMEEVGVGRGPPEPLDRLRVGAFDLDREDDTEAVIIAESVPDMMLVGASDELASMSVTVPETAGSELDRAPLDDNEASEVDFEGEAECCDVSDALASSDELASTDTVTLVTDELSETLTLDCPDSEDVAVVVTLPLGS